METFELYEAIRHHAYEMYTNNTEMLKRVDVFSGFLDREALQISLNEAFDALHDQFTAWSGLLQDLDSLDGDPEEAQVQYLRHARTVYTDAKQEHGGQNFILLSTKPEGDLTVITRKNLLVSARTLNTE